MPLSCLYSASGHNLPPLPNSLCHDLLLLVLVLMQVLVLVLVLVQVLVLVLLWLPGRWPPDCFC